jgi:DNA-binding NarL/FixJ family response regulator
LRILVVEDFEPFRRLAVSTLQERPELLTIYEASDGLEAVQKAQELQPDLIVLDIGLPTLNGIEAARRIRKLSPQSKMLFLSQESSAEIVQEALGLGASGYVVKAHAGGELSAAVEAVLRGNQFVGSGVAGDYTLSSPTQPTEATSRHTVQFYSDDVSFVDGFVSFIEPALRLGNAAIVVATSSRTEAIIQQLYEHGLDMTSAIARGRFVSVDVADMLSTFMVGDLVDPVQFLNGGADLITASTKATGMKRPRVVLCGECASILWSQGKADAAIELERLSHQLAERCDVDILCGFPLSSFCREEDKQVFERICLKV